MENQYQLCIWNYKQRGLPLTPGLWLIPQKILYLWFINSLWNILSSDPLLNSYYRHDSDLCFVAKHCSRGSGPDPEQFDILSFVRFDSLGCEVNGAQWSRSHNVKRWVKTSAITSQDGWSHSDTRVRREIKNALTLSRGHRVKQGLSDCDDDLYLVDLQADGGVARGSDWVNGELPRGVLKPQGEDGVEAGVGVLDLHVEVGQWGAEGDILLDPHLVLRLVEGRSLVIDIPDGDGHRRGGGGARVSS